MVEIQSPIFRDGLYSSLAAQATHLMLIARDTAGVSLSSALEGTSRIIHFCASATVNVLHNVNDLLSEDQHFERLEATLKGHKYAIEWFEVYVGELFLYPLVRYEIMETIDDTHVAIIARSICSVLLAHYALTASHMDFIKHMTHTRPRSLGLFCTNHKIKK